MDKTTERIKDDAEAYANDRFGEYAGNINDFEYPAWKDCADIYIAGATAEAEKTEQAIEVALHKERNALQAKMTQMDIDWLKRAQKMADALEWIKTYGPVDELTVKFIDNTLEQWKGTGKEVENG